MKLYFIASLLFFALFVRHSCAQNSPIDSTRNEVAYSDPNGNTVANIDGRPSSSTGLGAVIRNTTNSILQRLEGPRDRVVEFIKPAVKSEFSRNVTRVLDTIWSRVQGSNSTIIQSPLFKNSIVIPINTTLNHLKKITAPENAELNDETNIEVVNLNKPEDETQFKEYLQSSTDKEKAITNPRIIFLVRDDDRQPAASEENSEITENKPIADRVPEVVADKHDEVNNNDVTRETIDDKALPDQVEPTAASLPEHNPTKSRRSARYNDNHYTIVTPTRVNHLFDNVQRNGMQECMAQALCEANCRPQVYNENRIGLFKRIFDRLESFGSNHDDYDYYVNARRHGQLQNDRGVDSCELCRLRYTCRHDREYIMDRLYEMGNFQ